MTNLITAEQLLALMGIDKPIISLNLEVNRNLGPIPIVTIKYYLREDEDGNIVSIFKKYKLVEDEGE